MGTTEYGATGFYVLPRASFRTKRDKLLFADLVEQANYRDSKDCKRGQLITSTLKLAEETGWTRKQIMVSIEHLQQDGWIQIERNGRKREGIKITIVQYDDLQKLSFYGEKGQLKEQLDSEKGQTKGQLMDNQNLDLSRDEFTSEHQEGQLKGRLDSEKGQLKGHSLTSLKHHEKHIKDSCPKRGRRVYDESTDAYKLAKYLRDRILRWKPNSKVPEESPTGLSAWADDIRKMIELDNRDKHDIAKVIQWATADSFWQANILSADKLRKQYDRLEGQMLRDQEQRNKKVIPLQRTTQSVAQREYVDEIHAGFEMRAANDMAYLEMLLSNCQPKGGGT